MRIIGRILAGIGWVLASTMLPFLWVVEWLMDATQYHPDVPYYDPRWRRIVRPPVRIFCTFAVFACFLVCGPGIFLVVIGQSLSGKWSWDDALKI